MQGLSANFVQSLVLWACRPHRVHCAVIAQGEEPHCGSRATSGKVWLWIPGQVQLTTGALGGRTRLMQAVGRARMAEASRMRRLRLRGAGRDG